MPLNSNLLGKYSRRFNKIDIAEMLVLLSVLLTWIDFIPRAIALWNYPVQYFDPKLAAAIWPPAIAGKAGVILFIIAGVSLIANWLSPRWLPLITAISFTQFTAIYWSHFASASHGSHLPILCLWLFAIFRLSKRRYFELWLLSLQVVVGLMFASAAYYKWTESGFYWTDGFEMQRRIFESYGIDGRWIPPWTKLLIQNKLLAHLAGIGELACQTVCFPALLLSLRWPRFRFLACFSAFFAAVGIHLGMTLYNYQFLPLCLIFPIYRQAAIPKLRLSPYTIALLIIPIISARISFVPNDGSLSRNVFPFANYNMFSPSGYPLEAERIKVRDTESLDFVQRDFFMLFGSATMDKKLEKFARAHRLEPEDIKTVYYDFRRFQSEPVGFKPVFEGDSPNLESVND